MVLLKNRYTSVATIRYRSIYREHSIRVVNRCYRNASSPFHKSDIKHHRAAVVT